MTDTHFDKLAANCPDEVTVRVRRGFASPRAAVWRAMTDGPTVRRWMLGPQGWSMLIAEIDARVGGTFRWRWRNDETGEEFGFHGEYLDVEAPVRLVSSEVFDPGEDGVDSMGSCTVTTELSEADGRTLMTMLIRYPSQAARDAVLEHGMTEGMEMSYARLDGLLPEVEGVCGSKAP